MLRKSYTMEYTTCISFHKILQKKKCKKNLVTPSDSSLMILHKRNTVSFDSIDGAMAAGEVFWTGWGGFSCWDKRVCLSELCDWEW